MTAAEWGNWFVATPNERLAFSGDEIAALIRDLAACERERDSWKFAAQDCGKQWRELIAERAALRDDGWICTHCGRRWEGPEAPGERRHWVDGVSEFDDSYLCGPVVTLPPPPKERK